MSQPLQSINLVAPGFKGVNSEDSPLAQDPSFAETADNAVIDKRGRIAARKGNSVITNDATALGGDRIHKLHYFYGDTVATPVVFSVGNNKIFSGTTTLTEETVTVDAAESAYTITDNNWKMVNFNDAAYFFQRGHQPLIYTASGGLETFYSYTGTATDSTLYCHEALAAYGRLWIASNNADSQIVYWSDLLVGTDFTGGSSGSIDVSKSWPNGHDEIRALAAHNNTLIIFGKHSILVYQNAFNPALMSLADTVEGVGAICRNSVQHIGTDVIFASFSGLKSFGRTIQEKSMPLSNLSGTITTEFIDVVDQRAAPVSSVYSPENSFYLITFPDLQITYCFDLKGQLENGAYRVTRWPGAPFTAYVRTPDGTLYTGSTSGVGQYAGFTDGGSSYRFKYYSPGLTFGDPSKLKMLKKLRPTIVGANNATVSVFWGYDLGTSYKSSNYAVGTQTPAYFGVSEYAGYSELSSYGISSSLVGGVYVVNKYLGEFPTYDANGDIVDPAPPTVGSGGGALLNGDSYFNVAEDVYYVYVSGQWTDLSTLTPSSYSEFTGGELTSRQSLNTTGNGSIVTVGVETDINGSNLSIQEINVLALIGKTI